MTVLVFNDRFSPNVGDGLLAACLEHELRGQLAGESVHTIDVDGKVDFPAPHEPAVPAASPRQIVSSALPEPLRSEVSALGVGRRLRRITGPVAEARAYVIGGGHLINGSGLYFPLRLRTLARLARTRGASLFVHSVGVTDPGRWRPSAARWLREAFDGNPDLRFVSVRDPLSARYWAQAFPNSPAPEVCPDPGLLTRKAFGASRSGEDAHVGVGVIADHTATALATGPEAVRPTPRFYLELCRALVRRGRRPCLFTNGDPEDHEALGHILAQAQQDTTLRGQVEHAPRPTDERRLVATIGRFGGLVAHRMHATIAAYSLGIPAVGLAWDRKLESFFRSVKRERYFIADPRISPQSVAERVDEACRSGIPEEDRRRAVAAAEEGVSLLADRLRAAELAPA